MIYSNFSDKSLLMMHDAVHRAIAADADATRRGDPPPCETKNTRDWRDHAQALEDEMVQRNIPFILDRF